MDGTVAGTRTDARTRSSCAADAAHTDGARVIAIVAGVIVALFFAYVAWHSLGRISRGRLGDFPHFYYAARAMHAGGDIYASWRQGYLYPPLWAFLNIPLASLPLRAAAGVQVFLNGAAMIAALALVSREVQRRMLGEVRAWRVLAGIGVTVLVLNSALRFDIEMGQTNSWLLLAIVLGLCTLDRRPWLAGMALGFAFNIKFLPAAFLGYLLIRRRWAAAGSFVVAIVLWSVLPMLETGWSSGLHNLEVAYAGVLDLLGMHTGLGVAAKNPMGASFSLSITSTMARFVEPGRESLALVLACGVLGLAGLLAMVVYRRAGAPFLRWPSARRQESPPWSGLVAMEWAGIGVVMLAFSPQTNSRHLVLLALPVGVGVCLLFGTARERRLGVAALCVLAGGILLPPGMPATRAAIDWWRGVGGQSWCMLVSYGLILLGAMGAQWRRAGSFEAACQTP